MKRELFSINGPVLFQGTRFYDDRGYFSELFNELKLQDHQIPRFVQDNVSLSNKDVFRGLHWQIGQAAQGKLVTCLSGAIEDYVVDIRRESETFGQCLKVQLNSNELASFWVPPGFAHGFHSLEADTIVHYKVTKPWFPEGERSMSIARWAQHKDWILSEKDANAPTMDDLADEDLF